MPNIDQIDQITIKYDPNDKRPLDKIQERTFLEIEKSSNKNNTGFGVADLGTGRGALEYRGMGHWDILGRV